MRKAVRDEKRIQKNKNTVKLKITDPLQDSGVDEIIINHVPKMNTTCYMDWTMFSQDRVQLSNLENIQKLQCFVDRAL
jgi:hypothetical protein